MNEDAVRANFRMQARWCRDLGSPFTARLCDLFAQHLDRASEVGRRVLDWPGDPKADALALRVMGALHVLARAGRADLARVYPPHEVPDAALWDAAAAALIREETMILAFLASAPQTNEVARSGILAPCFLHIAKLTGMPLALYEIGASAGLNLNWDRYAYRLGDWMWGDPASSLMLTPDSRGTMPPVENNARMVARHGCDRAPLDPASPKDRDRLMAYVWADQSARLSRLEAALAIAASSPPRVEMADAGTWLTHAFARPGESGIARVLYHSIVWQYLPPSSREEAQAAIDKAAREARPGAPFAWLRFEMDEDPTGAALSLTLWPGGETRFLGRADFHGRWVDWA